MAKALSLASPIKVITSGSVPTTSNLKKGEWAYGAIGGVNRFFGNPTGNAVVEFSAPLLPDTPYPIDPAEGGVGFRGQWINVAGWVEIYNAADFERTVDMYIKHGSQDATFSITIPPKSWGSFAQLFGREFFNENGPWSFAYDCCETILHNAFYNNPDYVRIGYLDKDGETVKYITGISDIAVRKGPMTLDFETFNMPWFRLDALKTINSSSQ
jgi:hypothetical protein